MQAEPPWRRHAEAMSSTGELPTLELPTLEEESGMVHATNKPKVLSASLLSVVDSGTLEQI